MFELDRKPSQLVLVVFSDQKSQKSQRISVPTDRQTLSMHRYLLIKSHRRSVGTPLDCVKELCWENEYFQSIIQRETSKMITFSLFSTVLISKLDIHVA